MCHDTESNCSSVPSFLPSFIHSFIHSFISLSVSRDVLSLFQSQFLKQHYLLLPLSISSILLIHSDHPVEAYVFFVIFLSLSNFHFSFMHYCAL